ncbi:hypothetical protein HPB51_010380 [Rhipicephalus microplus]|uniref:Uncharacterized protein n=1 Tax=Rhipicephalus microplus TaxID=6941 RepID=A0A9J6EGI6_RHIMP|nr:hypothetical protein HPB51_010380 [Rhipicephalus microplus]
METASLEKISKEETIRLRDMYIGKSCTVFFKSNGPLKIVRGQGQYMYDESGNAYLDCINNVAHVGHCHPHVVKAGAEQMALLSTNSRYRNVCIQLYVLLRCCQHLVCLGPIVSPVYFKILISGLVGMPSEANDLAMRLAKCYTKNKDIICLDSAYHGHLQSTTAISPYKFNHIIGWQKKKSVHVAPLPCTYRGKYRDCDYPPGTDLGLIKSWLAIFKVRHGIATRTVSEEGAAADADGVEQWQNGQLKNILEDNAPNDIFNMDESALFFKLLPTAVIGAAFSTCIKWYQRCLHSQSFWTAELKIKQVSTQNKTCAEFGRTQYRRHI